MEAYRGGSRAAGAGGPGSRCAARAWWRGWRAAHGLPGGRAEAPGRGASLRRQGARAVARPKGRGAAAREPKASARGAARGKRAAPMQHRSTTRRSARNARGAPDIPLVALARQFASLSAEHGPTDMSIPCEVGARRREPRPNEQGGGLGGSRGAGRCGAAPCEQRAADARVVGWGARRLRCGRGEGETCGRAAGAERRRARRIRVGWWRVRPRKPSAPKAPLSCVDRLQVSRSGALPCSRKPSAWKRAKPRRSGPRQLQRRLRRSHRRGTLKLRGRAKT